MSSLSANQEAFLKATCAVGAAMPYWKTPSFQLSGCGTFISENELVTCAHVLVTKDGKRLPKPLILIKNQDGQFSRVKAMHVDEGKDLAYLQLKQPLGHSHVPYMHETRNVDLKDKFRLLSHYRENPKIETVSKINSSVRAKLKWADKGARYDVYLTDEELRKGYSGSAILMNGEICSILSAKKQDYPKEVWAASQRGFVSFMNKARAELKR